MEWSTHADVVSGTTPLLGRKLSALICSSRFTARIALKFLFFWRAGPSASLTLRRYCRRIRVLICWHDVLNTIDTADSALAARGAGCSGIVIIRILLRDQYLLPAWQPRCLRRICRLCLSVLTAQWKRKRGSIISHCEQGG